MSEKLSTELKSFQQIWKKGYYEGDPLDVLGRSKLGPLNYMSVLHATYLRCIKPYINSETVALEIGPGRGAWTKSMLAAREVWALDALSAKHNGFFEYLGTPSNVRYFQVSDFSCSMLPDDHFSFLFSYGCLCHVSFEGISQYARNLYPKLKDGCDCFWYVADYEKYNRCLESSSELSVWLRLCPERAQYKPLKWLLSLVNKMEWKINRMRSRDIHEDAVPSPGRWYHAGIDRTCNMLKEAGYTILDADVGTICRDPIIHFRK